MELANTCTGNPSVSMQPPGAEPNVENKLFVGGCPPGSVEEELRKIFEPYGTIEEIFIMRGGSRSGMACAFVRYQTQQMAQMAIEAIHGQITLPNASEPLVVRWADAPGTRRRGNRRGGNTAGSSVGAGGSGGRELHGGVTGHGGQPMMLTPGGYGYGPMPVAMQMQIPMQVHCFLHKPPPPPTASFHPVLQSEGILSRTLGACLHGCQSEPEDQKTFSSSMPPTPASAAARRSVVDTARCRFTHRPSVGMAVDS
uniref:RRM domain-containing protein n=1 Tax=Chrysotila carterae TaxID=13221 RepID=A0A7S4EVL6_CHRCT